MAYYGDKNKFSYYADTHQKKVRNVVVLVAGVDMGGLILEFMGEASWSVRNIVDTFFEEAVSGTKLKKVLYEWRCAGMSHYEEEQILEEADHLLSGHKHWRRRCGKLPSMDHFTEGMRKQVRRRLEIFKECKKDAWAEKLEKIEMDAYMECDACY